MRVVAFVCSKGMNDQSVLASFVVNGRLLVSDGTVTFEQLRDATRQDPEYFI